MADADRLVADAMVSALERIGVYAIQPPAGASIEALGETVLRNLRDLGYIICPDPGAHDLLVEAAEALDADAGHLHDEYDAGEWETCEADYCKGRRDLLARLRSATGR